MIWFVIGFIILIVIIIVCLLILKGLSKEENQYMEVSDHYLKNIGKSYTREEYASWAYQTYERIISAIQNEDYYFLRDILSDEIYNHYLLNLKNAKDRNVKNIVREMKPSFQKLVSLVIKDNLEISKVWIKVSYIEYTIDLASSSDQEQELVGEKVIAGSKDKKNEKEYMLTFVKERTEKESVACPHCGYITHIISQNHCSRCGATVVNKKYHWVLVGKEEIRTNSSF
ncbi:MAG: TIM44-like domain-containing protein [bacterium]|nr:TIM44-like domain-containing protein [bacterium]